MAEEPGLGTSERYLISAPAGPSGRSLHYPSFPDHALNRSHGDKRSRDPCRNPVPGLRRVLFVFIELAALHHRGRYGARSDPCKIRQCKTVGHALRGESLFGAVRPYWRGDLVRNLCASARSVPDLHARRCRMRHGAAKARPAGADVTLIVIPVKPTGPAFGRPDDRLRASRDPYRVISQ